MRYGFERLSNGKLKNIVVIYNGLSKVDKSRCPDSLRNIGTHIPSDCLENGVLFGITRQ